MRTHVKPITIATMFTISAMAVAGTAYAATHHSTMRGHENYSEACTTLAGQWSEVSGDHHRHMKSARRQEEIGARECRSKHTSTLKAGTEHYRTALRLLGVKPHA